MFEPLVEAWKWIVSIVPTSIRPRRPQLNFITVHYLYILAMTIFGSILLFPAGGMAYIDALFFAAGMATQSGLNTIDINNLNTYQQVVMMLVTCFCTPIFINTVVVFVRLYWFEKRFEHIVKDLRNSRRSRTRSLRSHTSLARAGTGQEEERDYGRAEMGVNGRPIKVLHETTVPNGMSGTTAKIQEMRREFSEKHGVATDAQSASLETSGPSSLQEQGERSSEETAADAPTTSPSGHQQEGEAPAAGAPPSSPKLHREITFADNLPTPSSPTLRGAQVPEQNNMSRHIQFLERQKNDAKKGGALRIPGPRDFDRGDVPKEVDEQDPLYRPQTKNSASTRTELGLHKRMSSRNEDEIAPESPTLMRRNITINEPQHPGHNKDRASEEVPTSTTTSRFDKLKNEIVRRKPSGRNLQLGPSRSFAKTIASMTSARARDRNEDPSPYLSWQATTGRNSMFMGLTEHQREELGGIEYRSLKTLAAVLLGYYFGFYILGVVVLLPWIVRTQPWKAYVESVGQSAVWWGIFTPTSMFNDLGFTLTPDSMNSFEYAVVALLFGAFLIIIGNTGFPCMLRFIIWVLSKIVPYGSGIWEELEFLLDHPRRCFTLLFPSKATWWLVWILILLNGVDLLFFIVLDLNGNTPVTSLEGGYKVLNGWFQAVSTRTAGFSCVNLAALHPAVQVSYMIMMYISVFPIAISVRRTNVYEEKSLGIFGGEEEVNEDGEPSYVGQHLRRQLSFDLWYIFLGLFIIAWVEGDRIQDVAEPGFQMFTILFEIVSAYGTVGLSLGYPGINASFSAELRTISKLVICAMMIRGRHRGLPYALDRAILLPSEKLQQKEADEASRRLGGGGGLVRRGSNFIELDEYGLPAQHLAPESHADPMTAGAGGPQGEHFRHHMGQLPRRTSVVSTNSRASQRNRSKSLGRLLAGGLSAGPTFSKND